MAIIVTGTPSASSFFWNAFAQRAFASLVFAVNDTLMSERSPGYATGHTVSLLSVHEASAECLVEVVTVLVVNFFAIEFFDGAGRNLC